MQYDMAVCEEDGEQDAPRRSEKDADGSDSDCRDQPTTGGEMPMDALGDAVPGKTAGVKEG